MKDNTGRWGPDDQRGALNLIDPQTTRDAVGLVRSGHTVALGEPLGPPTPVAPHRHRPLRFMDRDAGDYALGARAPGGFKFAEDTVQFATHSGTHIDALAHAWSGDTLYNGHPQNSTRSTRGAQRCGAENLVPVATRGVLVDLVAANGGPLPARAGVEAADLAHGIRESGIEVGAGDAVLIRTGWYESKQGAPDYFADEPGITEGAAQWLAERDVSLVGADNYAIEQQDGASGFPAHLLLLHGCGVPLIENVVLAELGDRLAEQGRSAFLLVVAPIALQGSTAAPVNPVAVL